MKTSSDATIPSHALATFGPREPLVPFALARRAPGPRDVVVAIAYCGVCHSDVHAARDAWGTSRYPMVPGHEITGVVRAVGAEVSRFRPGDRVGVGCFVGSCHGLPARDPSREHYLPGLVLTYGGVDPRDGEPTQGGYSDAIVVDEGYVLAIPESLPLDAAAPLLCAGITVYSPLRHWNVGPGSNVAIVGLGGLGHVAVKIARAMGARVTVLSRTDRKREDALRLGAEALHATSDPRTFEALAGAFDLVLSTVSGDVDWDALVGLLALDGTLVTVGVPASKVPVSAVPLIVGRRRIAGSFMGSIAETQEMLGFCADHGVVADIETIGARDVGSAFDRLEQSRVRYRFVLDCATLGAAEGS